MIIFLAYETLSHSIFRLAYSIEYVANYKYNISSGLVNFRTYARPSYMYFVKCLLQIILVFFVFIFWSLFLEFENNKILVGL